ncbi:aminoglycoside phosphotransferase family protein [Serinicoccus marinus]|uniref:aminoglycoside phosphotransferase family protein n=1 Tax=Serinicoccus marinus TaxID=247333 RepID=UPI0003B61143|nr:aminoglycoside phosphotransferase family protein [Serinicoccus marinus]
MVRGDDRAHGDLHLGNVLDGGHGGHGGLVAIDPQLCVGDPCFDLVDFVVVAGSPAAMRDRAGSLARLLDLDRDHVYAWTRVNAAVTAISLLTWEGPSTRTEALLTLARDD